MASAFMDLAAGGAALKELYDGQELRDSVYKTNPLFALMKKDTGFYGENKPIPILTSSSQGGSAQFGIAQQNQAAPSMSKFLLTRARDYSLGTIDNETMLAGSKDIGSFVRLAKVNTDAAWKQSVLSLGRSMYRSGTGSIGQIASITSGVITLVAPQDIVFFEQNMILQSNATDGGATPQGALGYVTNVNRRTGVLTVSATARGGAPGTPSGWTTNYFLLRQGDNNACISGLAGWVPTTAPGSTDNWFGVNRSPDSRLYGNFYDGTGMPIEQALINGLEIVGRENGEVDYCFVSYATYSALKLEIQSKRVVQYEECKGMGTAISFKAIVIEGDKGEVKVIADRNCQSNTAWMLQMDTWELNSLGEAPQVLRYLDSNEYLRVNNQDAAELRIGFYGQVACNAPSFNIRVATSA